MSLANFVSTVTAAVVTVLAAPLLHNYSQDYAAELIMASYSPPYWDIVGLAFSAGVFLLVFVAARLCVQLMWPR